MKENISDNPWRNMMQNLEMNTTKDNPVEGKVVGGNTAESRESKVSSPADSPVYRASDDEVTFGD